jgi:DNA-binding MarR family transcriptional regulator
MSSPSRRQLYEALKEEARRLSSHTVIFSHAVAERVGVASRDMECADIVNLSGPLTAGRLAELTGLTTGAITGMVDRLEKARLVRRERDARDRRKVIIHPVRDREAEVSSHFAGLGRSMGELWGRYDDRELSIVLDFLRQSNAVLQQETVRLRTGPRSSRPRSRRAKG